MCVRPLSDELVILDLGDTHVGLNLQHSNLRGDRLNLKKTMPSRPVVWCLYTVYCLTKVIYVNEYSILQCY